MADVKEIRDGLRDSRRYRREYANRVENYYDKYAVQIDELIVALDGLPVQRVSHDDYSIEVSVTGDKEVMKQLWGRLLTAGYSFTGSEGDRPQANQPSWSGSFRSDTDPDLAVWLSFASTKCKRVQVGTKTEVVPVYETVCEEEDATPDRPIMNEGIEV